MKRDHDLEVFVENLTEAEANTLATSIKRIAAKYGANIKEIEITKQPYKEIDLQLHILFVSLIKHYESLNNPTL